MNSRPAYHPPRGILLAAILALYTALRITRLAEWPRFQTLNETVGPLGWLFHWNTDTTPIAFLLVCLPIAFLWKNAFRKSARFLFEDNGWLAQRKPLALAIVVTVVTLFSHARVAAVKIEDGPKPVLFGELPPAFHDEYSYLFQTDTFLSGGVTVPAQETHPEIFDQMHVLNEGYMASRYFPGVGAWFAAFRAADKVYWAQWIAGALSGLFVFLTARELAGNAAGLFAGMLFAASPGIRLFGNLLLAHHPTLLGLTLFLYCYVRFMKTGSLRAGFFAGCGLSFAMLCRPMSAAGFGLPMGVHLFVTCIFSSDAFAARIKRLCAVGAPVIAGLTGLLVYNASVTGSSLVTPYQLYTDTYTPRHVYGFNNVKRGEEKLGPKVIEHYDTWAENLDGALAWDNVKHRVIASFQWTHGLVPIACACVTMLVLLPASDWRRRMILLSLVSLHLAHVPYWFVGIMNWHYVFESAPLLVILVALAVTEFGRRAVFVRRFGLAVWCCVFAAVSFIPNTFAIDSLWPVSRLDAGISELAFSRRKYADFAQLLQTNSVPPNALVLVIPDPDDRHIDYVTNSPNVFSKRERGPLVGRLKNPRDLSAIVATFSDRHCYTFDAKTGVLKKEHEPGGNSKITN